MEPSAAARASVAAGVPAAEPRPEKSATPHGAADSAGHCGTRLEEGRRTPLDISSSETPRQSWTFPAKLGGPKAKAIALVALILCLAAGVSCLYLQGEAEAVQQSCPEGMQPALTGNCAGAVAQHDGRRLQPFFRNLVPEEVQGDNRLKCTVCVVACAMTMFPVAWNNYIGVTGTHIPACPEGGPSQSTICTRTFGIEANANSYRGLHHPDEALKQEHEDPKEQRLQEYHEQFPSWTGHSNTDGVFDRLAAAEKKEGGKEYKDWSVEAALHQSALVQAGNYYVNAVEPGPKGIDEESKKPGRSHKGHFLNLDKVKEKWDGYTTAACAKAIAAAESTTGKDINGDGKVASGR